jgi:hypothetical protein
LRTKKLGRDKINLLINSERISQAKRGEHFPKNNKKKELVREKITHIQKHSSTYQLIYPYNTKTLTYFFKRGHHPNSFPLSQPYTQD